MSKNNSHVLPTKYPLITSFPRHANIFSILQNDELILGWFFENYISLQINKISDLKLDFHIGYDSITILKYCPFIIYDLQDRVLIDLAYSDILDYFIDKIDQDIYLYFMVDKFYISNYRQEYGKKHIYHDILIYGYDKEKQVFYGADFFKGKYSQELISNDELRNGYLALNIIIKEDWLNGVVELKPSNTRVYDLNIHKIRRNITEYLDSKNPTIHNELLFCYMTDDYYIYGLSIYHILNKYINNIIDNNNDKYNVDIKLFHVLYDHKKMMTMLAKYLQYEKYFKNEINYVILFDDLLKKTMILRNKLLKYNEKKDKNILLSSINILIDIQSTEEYLLEKFIIDIDEKKSISHEFSSSESQVVLLGSDNETKGDWITKYGKKGFDICCVGKSHPKEIEMVIRYDFRYCNEYDTFDKRACQSLLDKNRISASFVGVPNNVIEIEIKTLNDNQIVSIYFLDWYRGNAPLLINAEDASSGKVFHSLSLEDCGNGTYLRYRVSGHVLFKILPGKEDTSAFFTGIFVD